MCTGRTKLSFMIIHLCIYGMGSNNFKTTQVYNWVNHLIKVDCIEKALIHVLSLTVNPI